MGLKDIKGAQSTGLGNLLGDRMDSRTTPTFLAPVTEIRNSGIGGFVLGWWMMRRLGPGDLRIPVDC